ISCDLFRACLMARGAAAFFAAGLAAVAFLAGALAAVLLTFLAGAFALVAMVEIRMLRTRDSAAPKIGTWHLAPDNSGTSQLRAYFGTRYLQNLLFSGQKRVFSAFRPPVRIHGCTAFAASSRRAAEGGPQTMYVPRSGAMLAGSLGERAMAVRALAKRARGALSERQSRKAESWLCIFPDFRRRRWDRTSPWRCWRPATSAWSASARPCAGWPRMWPRTAPTTWRARPRPACCDTSTRRPCITTRTRKKTCFRR